MSNRPTRIVRHVRYLLRLEWAIYGRRIRVALIVGVLFLALVVFTVAETLLPHSVQNSKLKYEEKSNGIREYWGTGVREVPPRQSKPTAKQRQQAVDCRNMVRELQTTARHVTFGYGPRFAVIDLARGARADAQILRSTTTRLTRLPVEPATTAALARTRAGFVGLSRSVNVHSQALPAHRFYSENDSLVVSAAKACAQ